MPDNAQRMFHFHVEGGVVDIPAASYSEARRTFIKNTGHEPGASSTVEVTRIES